MTSPIEDFRLPDSGLARCYDEAGNEIDRPEPGSALYGQDGCFPFHPLSYTKLGRDAVELPVRALWSDGFRMVLDNNTGLMWEVKSPDPADLCYRGARYTWLEAQDVHVQRLNAERHAGFDDWRVPNQDELRSIVDYGRSNPAADDLFFSDCQVGFYWSCGTYRMQPQFGWGIFFGLGSGIAFGKSNRHYVRAVRGGRNQRFGQSRLRQFQDNGDGTVSDLVTGLMWQKGENPRMSWFDAVQHCGRMRLGGCSDWRLPNIKELNSILNLEYTDGWWYHKDVFPAQGLEPPLLHYFSSTTHESTYAWVTNFCFGYDGYYASKKAGLLFRAVRRARPAAPRASRFRLPHSGQTECFDDEGSRLPPGDAGGRFPGQDGSALIHPFSFTKLREGGIVLSPSGTWREGCRTVRDDNTGLIWEVKSPHPGDLNDARDTYGWEGVQEHYLPALNRAGYGGFTDWRLPNREELRSIVDYSGAAPAVDPEVFPDCQPAFYWSRDRYAPDERLQWGIYFAIGCAICYSRKNRYFVRAVRGGFSDGFGDPQRYSFQDNHDGTVTDRNTDLMWKQAESPEMNWEDALRYCRELSLAGHVDWRLPTIKELATLLDLSHKDGVWFHRQHFPGVKTAPLGFYWASTTYGASFGWGVNFQFGYDGYYAGKKTGKYPFRPVRNILPAE